MMHHHSASVVTAHGVSEVVEAIAIGHLKGMCRPKGDQSDLVFGVRRGIIHLVPRGRGRHVLGGLHTQA